MKRQMSLWKKYILLMVMLICGFCFAGQGVLASEETTEQDTVSQNTDLTVQLMETASTAPTQVIIHAVLPQYTYCDYEIYRASKDPENGGELKYLDTISELGMSWWVDGSYEYAVGPESKIVCYKAGQLTGGVIFIDTQARLGKTYWYQIVLKDRATDAVSKSNIIVGESALSAPRLKKCYTISNSTVQLVWERSSKAQGYEVYRKTGSGKWKRIKVLRNKLATGYKNKKLKAGKTYQYKVRAYHKSGGRKIYSEFSAVYKVKTKTPSVKGTYKQGSVYGPSLTSSKLAEVRRVVQSFKDNYIKKGMTDYEKLWMAFCYLRDNCSYAASWQYNGANTAWGALVYGEAQCSGYARAMKALCDAIGIKCYYVHADSKAVNPSHQWVQVKLGKKWYVVDAQGGFFLVGSNTWKNYVGMSWNTKSLPTVSKSDHSRGGFVSSEM